MKNLVLLSIVFIFCSCGSSKNSIKNDVHLKTEQNIVKVDSSNILEHNNQFTAIENVSSKTIDKNIETSIVKEDFDSSGRLISRTTTKQVKTSKVQDNKDEKNNNKVSSDKNTKSASSLSNNIKSDLTDKSTNDKEHKETTIPKQIGFMFIGIGLFVIVCLIAWVAYKKKLIDKLF